MQCQSVSFAQICAFVEVNGFRYLGKFYCREFFFVNRQIQCHYEVDGELPYIAASQLIAVRGQFNHQAMTRHGIKYKHRSEPVIKNTAIGSVLKVLYDMHSNKERPFLGFSNNHFLQELCDKIKIPYYVIQQTPNFRLPLDTKVCKLHEIKITNPVEQELKCQPYLSCAALKGRLFWAWIEIQIKSLDTLTNRLDTIDITRDIPMDWR